MTTTKTIGLLAYLLTTPSLMCIAREVPAHVNVWDGSLAAGTVTTVTRGCESLFSAKPEDTAAAWPTDSYAD